MFHKRFDHVKLLFFRGIHVHAQNFPLVINRSKRVPIFQAHFLKSTKSCIFYVSNTVFSDQNDIISQTLEISDPYFLRIKKREIYD